MQEAEEGRVGEAVCLACKALREALDAHVAT